MRIKNQANTDIQLLDSTKLRDSNRCQHSHVPRSQLNDQQSVAQTRSELELGVEETEIMVSATGRSGYPAETSQSQMGKDWVIPPKGLT